MNIEDWTKKNLRHLMLSWSGGDLTDQEKRLQDEFNDEKILCRYSPEDKNVQVWYLDVNRPYCVATYPLPFIVGKAVEDLRDRQRTDKDLLKVCKSTMARNQREQQFKINDTAHELAVGAKNIEYGRVITSG